MCLRLLQTLRDGECTVGDLAERIDAGQANVSKHLQVLLQQGFVDQRKQGTTTWYRVTDPQVFKMCELVVELAGRRAGPRSACLLRRRRITKKRTCNSWGGVGSP